MSASRSPTVHPSMERATARFTATVLSAYTTLAGQYHNLPPYLAELPLELPPVRLCKILVALTLFARTGGARCITAGAAGLCCFTGVLPTARHRTVNIVLTGSPQGIRRQQGTVLMVLRQVVQCIEDILLFQDPCLFQALSLRETCCHDAAGLRRAAAVRGE